MTTIKSICFHNLNIRFYLLNKDFPPEWFSILNTRLNHISSEIFDIKIQHNQIQNYKTYAHINSESTYFRYFIPELIKEDKVLYLDADLVVNGVLDNFFNIDLGNNFIAATEDIIASTFYPKPNKQFNAGVMLINNKKWRNENIFEKAIEYTNLHNEMLKDGDQEVLNHLFLNQWLELSYNANYLIGFEYLNHIFNANLDVNICGDDTPLIVHYNTAAKPWNNLYSMRFRNLYWAYYNLEWIDIIKKHCPEKFNMV